MGQIMEFLGNLIKLVPWGSLGDLQRFIEGDEPKRVAAEFARFVGNGCRLEVVIRQFKTWKTITIGGKSSEELLAGIKVADCFVFEPARDIMGKSAFRVAEQSRTVDLARSTVRDLGFTEMPTTAEFFARIEELGAELCPAEVGPHLRLQFTDQPMGDCFWVAMEPITDSDGNPRVFYVACYKNGRWLRADYADPSAQWNLDIEFVFALRT